MKLQIPQQGGATSANLRPSFVSSQEEIESYYIFLHAVQH